MSACVPTHTVKPLPNFVKVGVQVGDKVSVVTRDGRKSEFVVREVTDRHLSGDDETFLLAELESIEKRAWRRPDSPCGGDKPLGCSVPWLVVMTSEAHRHYKDVFHDACAQHDYCYGHGSATYGHDRTHCDDAFLIDMRNLCPKPATTRMGKFFDLIDDSVSSKQVCETVAEDYYNAVRYYGEDRFLDTTSTYCEYDGPPLPPSADAADDRRQ